MKRKTEDVIFIVLMAISVLFCCKCFLVAQSDRIVVDTIGGEVFSIALPVLILLLKVKLERARTNRLKMALKRKNETIRAMLNASTYTSSQRIVGAQSVAENPTR